MPFSLKSSVNPGFFCLKSYSRLNHSHRLVNAAPQTK
nr:MAG TPA: hypothetical protein [Caudoviricetes sp.]